MGRSLPTASSSSALIRLTGGQGDLWNEFASIFPTEQALASAALALGADKLGTLTPQELGLITWTKPPARSVLKALVELIGDGHDPLGDAFCALRTPTLRRENGATYTPALIVQTMVDWASAGTPARVVDPGVGSARFLMRAASAFPKAELVGVDIDPLATLVARSRSRLGGSTGGLSEAMARLAVLRPTLKDNVPLYCAAAAAGVPLRTAQSWLARYRRDQQIA